MTSSASKEWKACLRRRGFRRYRCCCCTGAARSGTCAPQAFPQDIQHRTVFVSGQVGCLSSVTMTHTTNRQTIRLPRRIGFFGDWIIQQVSPIKGRGGMDGGKQVSETDCLCFVFVLGARQRGTAVKNLMMWLVLVRGGIMQRIIKKQRKKKTEETRL